MTDKSKNTVKPSQESRENPNASQGNAILSESHSQDADRKLHIRHPHSEK